MLIISSIILKMKWEKNIITVIFCTDYYINMPIKHRIYVL